MRKMSPAARSVEPDMGLNRATKTTSVYDFGSSMMAGKSAESVWHMALGAEGASDSARTAQLPLNACAPEGRPPTWSASKLHLTEVVNAEGATGDALGIVGDWVGLAHPASTSVTHARRQALSVGTLVIRA